MINLQNPLPPNPVNAIEIDSIVRDLQMKLDTNLTWLSHNYARAYRHLKRQDGRTIYFPEVYMGIKNDEPQYYRPTPDNDKKGMCFFVVGKEEYPEFEKQQHNYIEHTVGVVFWVNLKLIDETLLNTEVFTQNLIRDVREVLTRKLLGVWYEVDIEEVVREFSQVYSEFSLKEQEQYLVAPYQAFRFNLKVKFQEDCPVALNRNQAILNNISKEEILSLLLPTLDFTDTDTFDALSSQQKTDLTALLCP